MQIERPLFQATFLWKTGFCVHFELHDPVFSHFLSYLSLICINSSFKLITVNNIDGLDVLQAHHRLNK